jgi:pSer/pThr/pTyr-binding forkhead associated (FHA) protein
MTVSGGVWSITDLDAKGGTFVNDKRVHRTRLLPGDCIRLGNTVLYLAKQSDPVQRQKKGGKHV